jgi:hypothetical protein
MPARNQKPNRIFWCAFCDKQMHKTREEAELAAERKSRRLLRRLSVYQCPHSGGRKWFHLTSQCQICKLRAVFGNESDALTAKVLAWLRDKLAPGVLICPCNREDCRDFVFRNPTKFF